MNGWWYLRDDERIGPVSTEELQALYQKALVDTATKVWQEGMDAWLPLSDVPVLNTAVHAVPPPLPITADDERRLTLPLAGRWRRFFARLFDLYWESLLVATAGGFILDQVSAGFVAWTNRPGSGTLLALLSIPVALLFDALLYSIFGNTPGKASLGLQVTSNRGERLPLETYLRRNLRLWVSGLGLGIPFLSLFTLAHQSSRLRKSVQASYDEELGTRVHAKPVGRFRKAAFGVAFGVFAVLLTVARLAVLEADMQRVNVAAQKFFIWNNPETGQDVAVDARWIFEPQTNAFGTRLFVFAERTDHAQVIFGPEDAPGMPFSKYVDAFLENTGPRMRFTDRGRFIEQDGVPIWEAHGTILAQSRSVLSVRIVQLDDTFWRLIVVQEPPVEYSSPLVDSLERALWQSVILRSPKPTT